MRSWCAGPKVVGERGFIAARQAESCSLIDAVVRSRAGRAAEVGEGALVSSFGA